MIPKTLLFTGVILAAAILALGGLAYQTVPVSKTQMITQTMTHAEIQKSFSFSLYETTNTLAYTTTSVQTFTSSHSAWNGLRQYTQYQSYTQTLESLYGAQMTATIPYSQNAFQTFFRTTTTMSSINVPAYATVGLDSTGLMALAIVTIVVLGGVTAVIMASYKSRKSVYKLQV